VVVGRRILPPFQGLKKEKKMGPTAHRGLDS
jgi:hypothetical protein